MPANDNEAWVGLIDKLQRLARVDAEDRHAIASLPYQVEAVPPARIIIREGHEVTRCCLLVDGYACRQKVTADGERQIVSFHMRGDMLDVQHLLLTRADHNVETITDAMVAWIPADILRRLAFERPSIGKALWRDALIDASIFREWVLNVGQRDARTRIAHMLCEFGARAIRAGVASEEECNLPITQEQIGDATGLTAVHVNRMLRALREEGALCVGKKEVQIVDFDRLRAIARFDAAYLHAAA